MISVVKLDTTLPTTTLASDCSSFPQYKHGGPIIAVQVENEYGSYYKDPAYMPYIKKVSISPIHFFMFLLLEWVIGSGVTAGLVLFSY